MEPILIYQMRKVGSSSLNYSIKKAGLKTLHFHRLFLKNGENPPRNIFSLCRWHLTNFRNKFYLKKKQVKIISLYRDPLSRNISSYFQNLTQNDYNVDDLIKDFENQDALTNTATNWFRDELFKATNIDIYQYSFDQNKGFTVIRKDNINILLMTMESLNANEQAISDFLGRDSFKLMNKNIGGYKWYNNIYKSFKAKYHPSSELLKILYDSDCIKYFYTSQEIKCFEDKWTKGKE